MSALSPVKQTLLLLAKVAVSFALLAYLLSTTDLAALAARVRGSDVALLAAAAALYAAMLAIATWRWWLLLKALGFPAPMRHLSESYLVATFFNNFLPSNIGGDLIRVRDSSRITGSTTTSLAVVAIDRILGFGALYVIAVVAYLVAGPPVRELAGARVALGGLALVFGGLAYLFFRPGTSRRLMARSGLSKFAWARDKFEKAQSAVHGYRADLGSVWTAFGASLALQILVVWYFVAVAHALRIPLPASAAFVMVPLCTLFQAIPISFNGWGIRESLFVVYFGQIGLPKDGALAFSLVGAGLIVALSLSGAVVWSARRSPADDRL
jgi:glycosyltransferase 2 family protein